MKIYTHNIKSKWHSYATFNGFDYSEEGNTIDEAQAKIKSKLESVGARFEDMTFLQPKINYERKKIVIESSPNIRYAKNRIDNLK